MAFLSFSELNHWLFRNIFYLTLFLRKEWFLPELKELERTQYLPHKDLEELQLKGLNRLLKHASSNVEFYKERIPEELYRIEELRDLPLLEKEQLRSSRQTLSCKYGFAQRLKTSGGSTGAPVTLVKDNEGMAREMAAMWRGYSWAGVRPGERQARFWGIPRSHKDRIRAQLIDFVCNRKRITAFEFNIDTLRNAQKKINDFNPDHFYGYTSILKEFAQAVGENSGLRPKAIITTSEVLTPSDRLLLEETFDSKVFDEYGCGELGTIAHECEWGQKHVNSENLIVEVLDDNGVPVPDGVSGELIVTDLTNYSMPLIRYRLKDFGCIAHEACPCGRTLPILSNIHGRAYEILENTKGKKFHGEFFLYLLEDLKKEDKPIKGVQFIQNLDSSLTVLVIAGDSQFNEIKNSIISYINRYFDDSIAIYVKKVTAIPREPSGKLQVVKKRHYSSENLVE